MDLRLDHPRPGAQFAGAVSRLFRAPRQPAFGHRHANLWHQQCMDAGTRLFHHIDHVAVHVMGVEAVDPDRHGLALGGPVNVVQRLNSVAPGLRFFG